ncbi:hypothetical protein IFR04_013304 [Cadophora malorum]|uniref:Uncharacterized protein n=1 Tax=Cadophora malorum TaxID=108018 RepID=A0A8H7T6W6_9HELO|nr:hypothetical protein IFR04_013304 [Cadophora malorum]
MAKKGLRSQIRANAKQGSHFWHASLASPLDETPYRTALKRALDCALTLEENFGDLVLAFDDTVTNICLRINGVRVLIHNKWATFETSHKMSPCWSSKEMNKELKKYIDLVNT